MTVDEYRAELELAIALLTVYATSGMLHTETLPVLFRAIRLIEDAQRVCES